MIEIDDDYAPIPADTKAILRQKTLLGETYVELTPGRPRRQDARRTAARLPAGQVSPTVELDEIFRTFDPTHAQGVLELAGRAGRGGRTRAART